MNKTPVSGAPAGAATPVDKTRWAYVGLLLACGMGSSMQIGKAPPALNAVQQDLHLGLVAGAWVISMFSVAGATLGSFAGSVVDRIGPHRAAVGGLFCMAVASLLGALAPQAAALLASRALEGMAFVIVVVAIPSLLMASASAADRRFVPSLWGIYMPSGMAVAIATAPMVLRAWGWRPLWQMDAATLAVLAVLLWAVPAPALLVRGRALPTFKQLLRSVWHPGPILLGVIFACYTWQYLSVMGFLPTILHAQGVAPQIAGVLTAVAVISNVAGNLAASALVARGVAPRRLLSIACVLMAIAAVGIFSGALPATLRYLFAVALSGCGGLIPASLFALVPRVAQDRESTATTMGFVVQCSHVGQLAGPPVVAVVAEAAGGWQLSALALVPMAVLAWVAARMLRRVQH